MRARVVKRGGRWEVTYNGLLYAWVGSWRHAYRQAVAIVEQVRRGEPTA